MPAKIPKVSDVVTIRTRNRPLGYNSLVKVEKVNRTGEEGSKIGNINGIVIYPREEAGMYQTLSIALIRIVSKAEYEPLLESEYMGGNPQKKK